MTQTTEELDTIRPRTLERWRGLDTLRALAILLVIPFHAMIWILNPPLREVGQYGWMGVDLFFVLSGFLVGSQVFQMIKNTGGIDFKGFYLRRSLRVLPAYWVVLCLYIVWPEFSEAGKLENPWSFLLFTANLPIAGKAFSHAWSLCVEEHFYLLLPILVWWYSRKSRKLNPSMIFGGLFLAGIALRLGLWYFYSNAGAHKWEYGKLVYYPTYTRMDGLLAGVALALIRVFRPERFELLASKSKWLTAIATCLICGGLTAAKGEKQFMASVFSFPLVSAGFACLVLCALNSKSWLAKLRFPGASLLATGSFSIYLVHKQMIHLAVSLVDSPGEHPFQTIGAAIALTIVGSSLLYFGVEKPGLWLRKRLLNFI